MDDELWAALVRRDAAAAGPVFFAVRSTGIYCRPGCPARTPKRENVRVYERAADAAAAGCRACKRCRPGTPIASPPP